MGVDGMYKFINKNFPDIYQTISINNIKGKPCIIDGMQHIYSQLIYMRSRDKEIITKCGKNISHIHGLINSLTYYLKNGIIPIFIFDGKTPEIKKKKIEERKKNLKDNLSKLRDLEKKKNELNNYINLINTSDINYQTNENQDIESEKEDVMIYGTPPVEIINLDNEIYKINTIQEEYKKIYKKSIVMKDYFIKDWIEILELLGLPVIKAEGEADPVCAYLLKNNNNIFGIISDDSDMLVFGAPILMRKSINQQFTIIELNKLLNRIEYLVSFEFNEVIRFNLDNLVDFSILLGTDYGTFKLNENIQDSFELLKYYIKNNKDFKKIISEDQFEIFMIIKKYYTEQNFADITSKLLTNPKWEKPKLMELKKRLLELFVDEDYIDKNNEFLDNCYNKIIKGKLTLKYDENYNRRFRSNSLDSKKYYYNSTDNYIFKKINKNNSYFAINNDYNNLSYKKEYFKNKDEINKDDNYLDDEIFYLEN